MNSELQALIKLILDLLEKVGLTGIPGYILIIAIGLVAVAVVIGVFLALYYYFKKLCTKSKLTRKVDNVLEKSLAHLSDIENTVQNVALLYPVLDEVQIAMDNLPQINNPQSLVLQKLGSFPRITTNTPLFEKHILLDNIIPSETAAKELSNQRDFWIETNTVFGNVNEIWKCRIIERNPDNFLIDIDEVYVSEMPLQTYQCEKDAEGFDWSVQNLGMKYAIFGDQEEDYHFIDETLTLDHENVTIIEF